MTTMLITEKHLDMHIRIAGFAGFALAVLLSIIIWAFAEIGSNDNDQVRMVSYHYTAYSGSIRMEVVSESTVPMDVCRIVQSEYDGTFDDGSQGIFTQCLNTEEE